MIPPGLIVIRIEGRNNRMIRLWLPIIILWPIYIMAIIAIAPFAFFAECFLIGSRIRPFSLLIALIRVIAATKGISVAIDSKNRRHTGKKKYTQNDNIKVIIM